MIPPGLQAHLTDALDRRQASGLLRSLRCWPSPPGWLNLADNDYLALSHDPAVIAAATAAARHHGCSSSASPLITGYQPPHLELEGKLCAWHGFPHGLVWNSGYSSNQAILSRLPRPGDLVLADRLIHNSMVAGILQSGARLIRYRHNDIAHLTALLEQHSAGNRTLFVVTESVFSMDGDYPDLAAFAALKNRYPFCLIVDEAHATGWYGPGGAGLVAEVGATGAVDVLVGTLGKALGSQGAYTLFHDPLLREFMVNEAAEFIFSTYLSPIAAAAAEAAVGRAQTLAADQTAWRKRSRDFRSGLRHRGWEVPEGDSPIIPVILGDTEATLRAATHLRDQQIVVGAVRPPTVPVGSSRLRLSLKRTMGEAELARFADALGEAERTR
jgi:8-amino-7-oxononanoate synthase